MKIDAITCQNVSLVTSQKSAILRFSSYLPVSVSVCVSVCLYLSASLSNDSSHESRI